MAKLEYRVISFDLHDKPIINGTKTERVKIDTRQERRSGLLGGEKVVDVPVYMERQVPNIAGHKEGFCDVARVVADMNTTLNTLASEGWRVISVDSVLRGHKGGSGDSSHGYSLTDAFVVVLEKQTF